MPQNPKSKNNLSQNQRSSQPAGTPLFVVPKVDPPPAGKQTLIVHNFQWHLIIRALAFVILAIGAVAYRLH